jgi:hypothetical protein
MGGTTMSDFYSTEEDWAIGGGPGRGLGHKAYKLDHGVAHHE